MREFRVARNEFDLTDFIDKIFDFMRQDDISSRIVASFSENGVVTEWEVEEINRDSVVDILFQGKIVFLPFSDINTGEPIRCADGNQYSLSDPSDLDEEVAISPELVEAIGFLVQVEQEEVIICGAVLKGGEYYEIDGVEMDEELKEFCGPMALFIEGFKHH